ncbi:hypothetical protein Mgra_00009581, partial [Meloidogyne graminicola]
FKYVENKWKYIVGKCCDNKCVNTDSPNGFCRKGNGFIQIKSNTEIVYIYCKGENKLARIESDHYFNKPINGLNQIFTLYYYEVKLIFKENEWIEIGLRNGNDEIYLFPKYKSINYAFQDNLTSVKLPSFTYKTNDIFGCGLVYPPPKLNNKLPYIFFTQNGKQIGKAILLEGEWKSIRPFVMLECCSIEANFGDSSFIYNVSKHCVANEFYKEEEFN